MKPLRIVCAAMKMDDGAIVTGVRHFSPDMRTTLRKLYGDGYHLKVAQQGFIDSKCSYHNRASGYVVAKIAGQLLVPNDADEGTLYSEDLY